MDMKHFITIYFISVLIGSLHLRFFDPKAEKVMYVAMFIPFINSAMAIIYVFIWIMVLVENIVKNGRELIEKAPR